MMQLFKAYFTQVTCPDMNQPCSVSIASNRLGRHHSSGDLLQAKYINDPEVLVDAAAAAGLNADEARAIISDPTAYRSEVCCLSADAPDCALHGAVEAAVLNTKCNPLCASR